MTIRMLKILAAFPFTFLYTTRPHRYSCCVPPSLNLLFPPCGRQNFGPSGATPMNMFPYMAKGLCKRNSNFQLDLKIGGYRLFVWALHDYMCPQKQSFLLAEGTRGSQTRQKGKSEIWSLRSSQCATVNLMMTEACAKERETSTTAAWS